MPIVEYDARSKGAKAYDKLAKEFLKKKNVELSAKKYFIDAINYVLIANVTESFKDKTMSIVFKICFIIFSVLLFFISISRNNLYEYVYII